MSSTTLVKVPCGCEILEVLDTQGDLYLRIEGCKEHPVAQGKKGHGWAIVNYIKQLEAEKNILIEHGVAQIKENDALKETLRIDWEVIVDAIDDHDIKQAVIRLWNRADALLTKDE